MNKQKSYVQLLKNVMAFVAAHQLFHLGMSFLSAEDEVVIFDLKSY